MRLNKKYIITSIAGVIIATGIAAGGAVFAASTTGTTFLERVATVLGVDSTKLTDAIKQVSTEDVNQMLSDGKITQTQANEMKQHIQDGEFRGLGGPMMHERNENLRFEFMDSLATYIGMTRDEIKTELDKGTKLADLITSKAKTVEEVKSYLTSEATTFVDKQLSDSKITQDEADKFKTNLSTMLDDILSGNMKFGRHGGPMRELNSLDESK